MRSRKDLSSEKDRRLHNQLMREYGVSFEKYNEILEAQGNACPITGKQFEIRKGKKIRLSLDHNHVTKKVRGVIDGNVNRGLGIVGIDDPKRALKAVLYIMRHCLTENGLKQLSVAVNRARPTYISR